MCDCKVYDLLRYLEDRLEPEARIMFEIIPGNLTCAAPPEWRGIKVKQLGSLKIQCPLPKLGDCPHPCMCFERPADAALIVDCSGLNLSQSPASLPDPFKLDNRVLWPRRIKLNHTELWLKGNSIVTLPWNTAPGYSRVTQLYLSHNNISTLAAEQVPPHLQVRKRCSYCLVHDLYSQDCHLKPVYHCRCLSWITTTWHGSMLPFCRHLPIKQPACNVSHFMLIHGTVTVEHVACSVSCRSTSLRYE